MLMEGSGGEGVGDMEGLEGMLGGDGAVGQTVVHISPEEEAAINRVNQKTILMERERGQLLLFLLIVYKTYPFGLF